MVLLGGSSLSTLFPGGSGFVGTYQLGYMMVLRNFGVSDAVSLDAVSLDAVSLDVSSAVQIFVMGFFAILGLLIWFVEIYEGVRPIVRRILHREGSTRHSSAGPGELVCRGHQAIIRTVVRTGRFPGNSARTK